MHDQTNKCVAWCREVTSGFDTLAKLEGVETTQEGIFVMPKNRIKMLSTYTFSHIDASDDSTVATECQRDLAELQERFEAQSHLLEQLRAAKLP